MNKPFNLNKPFVFLDIDGVLNSSQFFRKENLYQRSDKRSHLDPEAIKRLNQISDWNFVLSSTWRKFHEIEEINKLLKDMGFEGSIADYTPIFDWQGSIRGNEIRQWMRDNDLADSNKYVIFDDDSDMLYWQRDNFIHVDNYFGIGPNHIYRAKRIMNF